MLATVAREDILGLRVLQTSRFLLTSRYHRLALPGALREGVRPNSRRNASAKWLWLENPSSKRQRGEIVRTARRAARATRRAQSGQVAMHRNSSPLLKNTSQMER